MIFCKNVYFSYKEGRRKHPALVDFSFSVERGELVCVLGPNGSGKSTLAKLFKGLIFPESGRVVFEGFPLDSKEGLKFARENIGLVFENPDVQIVSPVVEEDLLFGLENLCLSEEDARQRIDEVSELLGIKSILKKTVDELSSGEKQRVALAGVLVMKPAYLFSDESSAWLDKPSRLELMRTFRRLAEKGMGVVHITHDPNEAVLADRVVVLEKGRLVRDGKPKVVFSSSYSLLKIGVRAPITSLLTEAAKEIGLVVNHPSFSPEEII